jgi:DNA-binding LacI/PurR family transcriptional regulator
MADIARLSGVSTGTVSRTLSGHPAVHPDTRRRVLETVDRLGYRPNQVARTLARGRSATLAISLPAGDTVVFANPYYVIVAEAIANAASAAGYRVHSAAARHVRDRIENVRAVLEAGAEGVILLDIVEHDPRPEFLARERVPFVIIGRPENLPGPWVDVDDAYGAETAVRHLLELGHRRIAHLAGLHDRQVSQIRLGGYRNALRAAGARPEPELVEETDYTSLGGYRATNRLLDRAPGVTAIFAVCDEAAIGAMQALADRGASVPDDVSVVGFDDLPPSALLGLTTIRQPIYEVGAAAAARLLEWIRQGKEYADWSGTVLPTRLVERHSTRAPHGGSGDRQTPPARATPTPKRAGKGGKT